MTQIDSYVLFAANINDFRSLAKKIISEKLADRLVDIASNKSLRHHDKEEETDSESSEYFSADSNESSDDRNYPDISFKRDNTVDDMGNTNKQYLLENKNIDLDELVQRVKEKLENNVPTTIKSTDSVEKSSEGGKIEDYYYIGDNIKSEFNNDVPSVRNGHTNSGFILENPQHDIEVQYNDDVDYNDGNVKEMSKYLKGNSKDSEFVQDDVIENMDNEITVKKNVGETNKKNRQYDQNENMMGKVFSKLTAQTVVTPQTKYMAQYYDDNARIEPNIDEQVRKDANANEEAEYYDDANNVHVEVTSENNIGEFKEKDMLTHTNDSYEDYVTPKKDNIFESGDVATPISSILGEHKLSTDDVNERFTIEQNKLKGSLETVQESSVKDVVVEPPVKQASVTTFHSALIRAYTAKMWFKDPIHDNYDDSTERTKANANMKTTRNNSLRTLFPTRYHVKISSPNYFAKLPAVAEKYNFEEPIPEKDREPENIKHIPNPPALINKKIKI